MIGVLFVISLFVALLFIADVNYESMSKSSSQWPRPWDKSMKRYRL